MLKIHQAADLSTSRDTGKSLLVENSVTHRQPAGALLTRSRVQGRKDRVNSQGENLIPPLLCLQNFSFSPFFVFISQRMKYPRKHIMSTCCQERCFIKTFALPLVVKLFSLSPGSAGLQYENDYPPSLHFISFLPRKNIVKQSFHNPRNVPPSAKRTSRNVERLRLDPES